MLTRLFIRNFKRFSEAEIDLDKTVVLIGPNNSGKTTALQALALWEVGLRRWTEKRSSGSSAALRSGVAINRRDLLAIPVPNANLLWRNLRVREGERVNGKPETHNIRIDLRVDGVSNGSVWSCGLEFDYANEESLYCRPLRLNGDKQPERMHIPPQAREVRVAFLPPMSGLADREFVKQPGEIGVLIGQGQTAQVLRNLCYRVCWPDDPAQPPSANWLSMQDAIQRLFGANLHPPAYVVARDEIVMQYRDPGGAELDLSSAGRGLQQTLLVLAHLYANPRTVLLLDEPDAHLEVLRQRQTYQLISEVAERQGSQVVAASHSEVVLNEAAAKGRVVAFVGKPHTLNDRGSQLIKSLTDIGWDQYYLAEQTGWVLYLENATDLAILQAFARKLNHPAIEYLERPFVYYVASNVPEKAREHFHGLREAKKDLAGVAIFDRLEKNLQQGGTLQELMWKRRKIENYFCSEELLLTWAKQAHAPTDLFGMAEQDAHLVAMREAIAEVTAVLHVDDKTPWSPEVKATDEVLDRVFRLFFRKMNLPLLFRKAEYHALIELMRPEDIDEEVVRKLDAVVSVARSAVVES